MISGTTQVIGIIGDPVTHSLSPAMHNAAFATLGLDMVYVPLPVRPGEVAAAVAGLAALGLRGANVTVPHKAAVLPHLSWVAPEARLAQAVNTIVVDGGDMRGYNTDIQGVEGALEAACGDTLAGQDALVLGAGGAARAVALALARQGMTITAAARSAEAAHTMAAMLGAVGAGCRWIPWHELDAAAVAAPRLVVNATSLGMAAAASVPDWITAAVHQEQIVFDVVYSAGETAFLTAARRAGALTIDGREMLLGQAVAAFTLWTGLPAPRAVMRRALEETGPAPEQR